MILALEVIVAIILTLATLPGTLELLLLTSAALFPSAPSRTNKKSTQAKPKTAVIIPAHNEESNISRIIKSVQGCQGDYDIIVVADNCTDHTAQKAESYGVRVLTRKDPGRFGKHYALQHAFTHLLKEDYALLFIVDADAIVEPNVIEEIQNAYANGIHAMQVKNLCMNPHDSYYSRLKNIAFTAFDWVRPRGRQRLGLSAGLLGNGFALSREILEAIPFEEGSITEDLAYHLSLVKAGYSITFLETTGVQAEFPLQVNGRKIEQARWEGGRLRLMWDCLPNLLKEIAKGNFRLIEPCFDLLLLPLGYHVILLLMLLAIPLFYTQILALVGLFVLTFHVLVALKFANGGYKDLLALLMSPLYVLQKLGQIKRIVQEAIHVKWERTPR